MSVSVLILAVIVSISSPRAQAAECELWTDSQNVTHARSADADGMAGVLGCLGYLHGRDRAWQMDYLRRTAQGRKAEILGYRELKDDFKLRLLGLTETAERVWRGASARLQAELGAYAAGVNAGRKAGGDDAYEFRELGYQPEPWTPQDSILLVLLQSFDQTRKSFETDLTESAWWGRHGDRARAWFTPDGLPWDTAILKRGEYPEAKSGTKNGPKTAQVDSHLSTSASRFFKDLPEVSAGSNNWVLAPSRSLTGKAWLANDPHLALKHPPFWYWVHLQGGDIDAIGASLPGVPLIASGASRRMAWGLTNSYLDVGDVWAVERSELRDVVKTRPWIWIRVGFLKVPFFFKTIERTSQGWPLLPLDAGAGRALVLRWSGYELASSDVEAAPRMMASKDVRSMDEALSRVGIPSWNFVFADTSGQIGYRAVGKVPRREGVPEWGVRIGTPAAALAPTPWLAPSEMPHVLNPARGFVATANNRQWPSGARHHAGRAHTDGFRALRIEELLAATPRHDRQSIARVQCDVQAVDARFLLPMMLARTSPAPGLELEALRTWNYEATLDCRACAVYRLWVETLMDITDLDEAALYRRLGDASDAEIAEAAREAWSSMVRELPRAGDGGLVTWAEVHRNRFEHLAGNGRFAVDVQDGGLATPGDTHSVNPGTLTARDDGKGYEHDSGASHRLIVELTTPPKISVQLAGPNLDTAKRELQDPQGPWTAWRDCRFEERVFPLDWSKLAGKTEKISVPVNSTQ